MIKVGIVAFDEGVLATAQALSLRMGIELVGVVALLPDAIRASIKFQNSDVVDAIIARKATATLLRTYVHIPVIDLDMSSMDILEALLNTREEDRPVALASVTETSYDIELDRIQSVAERLSLGMVPIKLGSLMGGETVYGKFLQEMCERGCSSAITTSRRLADYLLDHGCKVEYVSAAEREVEQALQRAMNMITLQKRERVQSNYVSSLLNYMKIGCITVTLDGRIGMVNTVVLQMLHISAQDVERKTVVQAGERHPLLQRILETRSGTILEHNGNQYSIVRDALRDDSSGNSGPGDGYDLKEVIRVIDVAKVQRAEINIRKQLRPDGFTAKVCFDNIVVRSKRMSRLIDYAKQCAASRSNILITGESGTGKEMLAQSIHNASPFAEGPFVSVNCAVLTGPLMESELYGYEEGAFTGAKKGGKAGLMELSHGGTLFLDEIGELPLELQSKLLRSIQEKQMIRVGGSKIIPIHNRIICATNRNLLLDISQRLFRADLYYRINILQIEVPSLRDRKEDIELLARSLFEKKAETMEQHVSMEQVLFDRLLQYDWPGNVRELEAFIERLIVISCDGNVDGAQFSQRFSELTRPNADGAAVQTQLGDTEVMISKGNLRKMEHQIVLDSYIAFGKNTQKTADSLGISRTTLWKHLKQT